MKLFIFQLLFKKWDNSCNINTNLTENQILIFNTKNERNLELK